MQQFETAEDDDSPAQGGLTQDPPGDELSLTQLPLETIDMQKILKEDYSHDPNSVTLGAAEALGSPGDPLHGRSSRPAVTIGQSMDDMTIGNAPMLCWTCSECPSDPPFVSFLEFICETFRIRHSPCLTQQ